MIKMRMAQNPRSKIRRACDQCGGEYETWPLRLEEGRGRYCSVSCGLTASRTRHGATIGRGYTPTFTTWRIMRQRCSNPANRQYANYGGRGITVCERWQSYENFVADMGERPDGMSIDRIDADGIYEPGNCRWATAREQSNNRRVTLRIPMDGEMVPLTVASERSGVPVYALAYRLKAGWPADRLFLPSRR